jgi:hypothetical protein
MKRELSPDDYYTTERLAKVVAKYRHWSKSQLANSKKEEAMIAYQLRIDQEIKDFDADPTREITKALLWG